MLSVVCHLDHRDLPCLDIKIIIKTLLFLSNIKLYLSSTASGMVIPCCSSCDPVKLENVLLYKH